MAGRIAMRTKYVRILTGEYAGELGTVENTSTSRTMLSVALDQPDGEWDGILVGEEDVFFMTKKNYFRAKLHGTL